MIDISPLSLIQPILRLLVSALGTATSDYSPAVLSQLFITIMGNLHAPNLASVMTMVQVMPIVIIVLIP